VPLLGMKARIPRGLPCAISVPNLIADRAALVTRQACRLNVRRLMYQALIWLAVSRDETGRLSATRDSQDLQRLANALVDSVRRNSELDRDLF